MRSDAVTYQPYVFNTNSLSRSSMSRVQPIGEDLTAAKTDFSGLTEERTNQNPLRPGQSANLVDILMSQFQMGRLNAERILKPAGTQTNEINRIEE